MTLSTSCGGIGGQILNQNVLALGTWKCRKSWELGKFFLQVRLPDAALGVVRPLLPGCPAKKRLPWPELMEDSQLKMRGIHICSAEAFLSVSRIQRQ